MIRRDADRLRIEGAVTLDTVSEALAQARGKLAPEVGVIDLAGVTEADSSLLSLLLELSRQRAGGLRVENAGAGIRSLAGLYGVDTLLMPPAA